MKNLILSLLILIPVVCFSQDKTTTIPFEIVRSESGMPLVVLDYEMKGVRMKLFYDTGMSHGRLSREKAEKIGLTFSGNPMYMETLGRGRAYHWKADNYYMDPVFGPIILASPSDSLANDLKIPSIDGYVGHSPMERTKCLEIDFQKSQLCYTDNLPSFYIENPEVQVVALNPSDSLYRTKKSSIVANKNCILGTLTVADSVSLKVNFFLDLGHTSYLFLYVYNNSTFNKMMNYKAYMTEKYGKDYPTVRFEIPSLSIDSLMANVPVSTYFEEHNLYKDGFGSAVIGGYLGVDFFLGYDKILFDWKNRKGYFYKEVPTRNKKIGN